MNIIEIPYHHKRLILRLFVTGSYMNDIVEYTKYPRYTIEEVIRWANTTKEGKKLLKQIIYNEQPRFGDRTEGSENKRTEGNRREL